MITDQAFVLHKRTYKDSSELIKLLTRHHGVVDVIGKGSRRPRSKLKGQLQPFIESHVSFIGKSALMTLIQSEQSGLLPKCAYLNHVAMLYCNELMLLLTLDNDTSSTLYEHYKNTINQVVAAKNISLILRRFEWELSGLMGYQLNLSDDVNASEFVVFSPINGIEPQTQSKHCTAAALRAFINNHDMSSAQIKQVNYLMRQVVDYLVQGKTIKSRALILN